ncbi:OR4K2 protein, partial [Geococcyx californianus]|nr:OR4K2 protein [Geococcyx californianus]
QVSNCSFIPEFLLLAFTDIWELQLLHFWMLSGIHLAAFLGKSLIITTDSNHHLQTPMWCPQTLPPWHELDLLHLCSQIHSISLWDTRNISYTGCASQLIFFHLFLSVESFLVTAKACDCYIAICQALHCGSLLGSRACVHMAAAAWGGGFLDALL